MPSTNRKKLVVKLLKYLVLVLLILGSLYVGFYIYLAVQPDDPPFDDSALIPDRQEIPPEQNGYETLVSALGGNGELPADYFRDLLALDVSSEVRETEGEPFRNQKLDSIEKFKEKYHPVYTSLQKVFDYLHLDIPRGDDSRTGSISIAIREMVIYALMLSWYEAKQGNDDASLEYIDFVLHFGKMMNNSRGYLTLFVMGAVAQQKALVEIHEMIDSDVMPSSALLELSAMLNLHAPSLENWEEIMKDEYEWHTYLLLEGNWIEEQNLVSRLTYGHIMKPNMFRKGIFEVYHPVFEMHKKPIYEFDHNIWDSLCDLNNADNLSYIDEAKRASEVIGRIQGCMAAPNFSRFWETTFYYKTVWNMTHLKIAILMYESENGNIPTTIELLTPDFIASIPIDPYDGKPLKYDPDRNLIYSSGFNFADDGGSYEKHLVEHNFYFPRLKEEKDIALIIH
ncbi:hypothetical protein ACFLQK_01370 [bacterium]